MADFEKDIIGKTFDSNFDESKWGDSEPNKTPSKIGGIELRCPKCGVSFIQTYYPSITVEEYNKIKDVRRCSNCNVVYDAEPQAEPEPVKEATRSHTKAYAKSSSKEGIQANKDIRLNVNDVNYVANFFKENIPQEARQDFTEDLSAYFFSEKISLTSTEQIIARIIDTKKEETEELLKRIRKVYLECSKSGNASPSALTKRLGLVMAKDEAFVKNYVMTLSKIWLKYKLPILSTIEPEIIQELSKNIFEPLCFSPYPTFIVADVDKKQTIRVQVSKDYKHDKKGEEITIQKLEYEEVIINAIPTKIIQYENPTNIEIKYEIEFETPLGHKFTTEPKILEEIIAELRTKRLVYKIRAVDEMLPAVINAYERDGEIVVKNEVDTPGFYLIDGKIVAVKTDIIMPTRDKIGRCVEVLDHLSSKHKHQDRYATHIKWGMASAFGFVMKQLEDEELWLPILWPYGWTKCGKTTDGRLSLAIYRRHRDKTRHDIGFASIDTKPKLGAALSYDTFGVLVNEVELSNLKDPKTISLVETIKHAVQSQTSRSRYGKNKYTMEHFSALSPIILTGNDNPPDDPALLGRTISFHYSDKDKPTEQEKLEFKEYLYKKRNIDELGTLGDFTASYILEHQDLIHDDWKSWTKKILTEFYKLVGKEPPEWVNMFVSETQLEDIVSELEQSIRGFFEKVINETYMRSFHTFTSYDKTEREHGEIVKIANLNNFAARLNFCLDKELISYLRRKKGESDIMILQNVLPEMGRNGIRNIHSLKNLASIMEGSYEIPKLGGRSARVAKIPISKFIEFVLPEIPIKESTESALPDRDPFLD